MNGWFLQCVLFLPYVLLFVTLSTCMDPAASSINATPCSAPNKAATSTNLSTTCLTPCPLLLWSVGKSSAATEAYPTRQRECSYLFHCCACLSFLSRSPLSYTEYGGITELLESLPRGAACANDAQQRFDIDATTSAAGILQVGSSCTHLQSVLSAAVFTFTVSISVQPSLQAPDVVWCTARWKGCDPGPTDVRDGGINWPNSDHQMQMSATCLRRWRALRAAHDIMWGDPMTTAFAELPDTQVMTRRAPFAAVKQCNSLCRGCWRRCLMVF